MLSMELWNGIALAVVHFAAFVFFSIRFWRRAPSWTFTVAFSLWLVTMGVRRITARFGGELMHWIDAVVIPNHITVWVVIWLALLDRREEGMVDARRG